MIANRVLEQSGKDQAERRKEENVVQTRRIRFCFVCPSHTRRETEETLRECNQAKWDTNEGRGTHWTNPKEPITDIEPVSEEEMRPRRLLHLHD